MRTVILLVFVIFNVYGQRDPSISRDSDGSLRVVIEGFPGVQWVTVKISGQGGKTHASLISLKSADGRWRANIPDVTDNDVSTIDFVIEYQLDNDVHEQKGTLQLHDAERSLAPVSKRYLQRRATTVFFDDFSSSNIDLNKWRYSVTASRFIQNHEFQMYTPEPANSYVKHGMLYIRPTLTEDHFGRNFMHDGHLNFTETWGECTSAARFCDVHGYNHIPPVMSAMLMSKGHIRYGKVEVVAKLPKGDWLWPAIWLMPTEDYYGSWPRSGEIDIMESRGNLHYTNSNNGHSMGADVTWVHFPHGTDPAHKARGHEYSYALNGATFGDAFHTFWMDWTENYINIGVDDHTIMAMNTPADGYWGDGHLTGDNIWADGGPDAPFDRPFYLLLDVAVGGHWFQSWMANSPYPQPWHDDYNNRSMEFWESRHLWHPTWHGEQAAFKIRSVKMQQY